MILAVVFLAGVLVGALLLGAVLAFLERDAGARGYVDLTGRFEDLPSYRRDRQWWR